MANPDPTGSNRFEEKKWIISRIDLYHKTTIDGLQNDLKKYESQVDKAITTTKTWRNNILTVLGFILTVFLGYSSSYHVPQFTFFITVTILGAGGLVTVVLFNLVTKLVKDFSDSYGEITAEGIGKLASSQGYFITRPTILPTVSDSFTNNYFWFTMLLTHAILISTAKSLRKLAKDYSQIKNIKSDLLKEAKEYEQYAQFIPFFFQKLDRSQEMPKDLLAFIDETLAQYKPKTNG